jgi:aryl carrier-like protein
MNKIILVLNNAGMMAFSGEWKKQGLIVDMNRLRENAEVALLYSIMPSATSLPY